MTKHTCKNCGNIFFSDLHTVYCDDCKPLVKKELICTICGKPFLVGLGKNGQFLQTKICDSCVKNKKKLVICDICGKEFELSKIPPDYRHYPKRTTCFNCKPENYKNDLEYKTLICETCGKEFTVPSSYKRVNCDNCKNIKQEFKVLKCQKCGKEFKVGRSTTGKKDSFLIRKYCNDCLKPAETKELVCENCGKTFTVGRYETNIKGFKKQLYCSEKCRKEGYLKKKINTSKQKYGVDFYTQTEEYRNKVIKTCLEKYGVPYPCMSNNCKSAQGNIISKLNVEFSEFLKTNYDIDSELEVQVGYYSYDLKVNNVLIELNPTVSHTCIETGIFDKVDKNKHLNKVNEALAHGYRCIHVWQWDDWNNIAKLIVQKDKLYARKLELKEITKQEANKFVKQNHIQGSCYGNIANLGLFNNEQLVQVMTFGKPRYNKNYQWELLRLCTLSGFYVVGGAERLFKHFIDIYQPKSIISYCDISKFTGDVYTRLGFKLKEQTAPQKIWSDFKNYSQKHITDNLLRQRGYDQLFKTNYGKGTSNEELMIKNGWLPVYDCGQKVFEWLD